MDTDGNLQYLGRADDVVKIRGNRIQLSEIDHHIMASGLVNQCATLLMLSEHANEEPVIVSCITPADCPKAKLRESLMKRMPPYMLPGSIMTLDAMPLTSSSKTDRMALKVLYQVKRHELQICDVADADGEEETVEDSLGQTQKGDQDAKTEQEVIRDLYVFGCIGIVISHWEMYTSAYYDNVTFPTMMVLGSIGLNIWHSQIFAVLGGYSDGAAGEESFASLGAKYQLWILLVLLAPWGWLLLQCDSLQCEDWHSWPESFWAGPRVYLVTMFLSRLFMMAMFKLRVPKWLMLVFAFPFGANLPLTGAWVRTWAQAQGDLPGDVLDVLGISLEANSQVKRYVMDYVVGVLAVPFVRAAGKTASLSLSRTHRRWLGLALWGFFGSSSISQALFKYFVHLKPMQLHSTDLLLVLPGVNIVIIHFSPSMLISWFRILLLAGALTCFPLTGVPARAKTSFLAAFLISGKTITFSPFGWLEKLPKWTSLQLVILAAYFLFFLGVAAALLQIPIGMGMRLLTKKSSSSSTIGGSCS